MHLRAVAAAQPHRDDLDTSSPLNPLVCLTRGRDALPPVHQQLQIRGPEDAVPETVAVDTQRHEIAIALGFVRRSFLVTIHPRHPSKRALAAARVDIAGPQMAIEDDRIQRLQLAAMPRRLPCRWRW